MEWWHVAALLALLCVGRSDCDQPRAQFSSLTTISTVVQDPRTGRIYLGAVDAIHQLDANLQKESTAQTGPKKDSPNCTPPITAQCVDAEETHNVVKLLLVNPAQGTLVSCGSVFRGICSLLNLSNVEQQVYYSDTKGEKTYVVTPDKSVSVVGVISTFINRWQPINLSVFLVGQGYGSAVSVKLVSTRLLQASNDMDIFENIVETSTVQEGPYMQRYQHDFRYAFKHKSHVFFLFSRAMDANDNRKVSFLARLCDDDQNYYSYIELQLSCSKSKDNVYNKVQAAYLTSPGSILAQNLSLPEDDEVLFALFSKPDSEDSALCMYPMSSINRRLQEALKSCYRGEHIESKPRAVMSPYTTKNEDICSIKIEQSLYDNYPCGAEFLPSPLATTPEFALSVSAIYTRKSLLTSVAVSVVNNNTVAFVGTNTGEVLKIHLTDHADVYDKFPGDSCDSPVNKPMFFDSTMDHLYITTMKKITKVPVQACEQKKDCHSCVSQRDPYCGWCVLEGRCTRKKECRQGEEKDAWLWSPNQKCLHSVCDESVGLPVEHTGSHVQ